MDEFTKHKVDKLLSTLSNINKFGGHLPDGLYQSLDDALHTIAVNVIDYYEGSYDEDEPNVTAFNTQLLLEDLIGISNFTKEAKDIE